jgi:spore maturation protein CgeB
MTSPLHLAFFGSSLVSSYWNGAATYYRGLIQQLAKHGCAVTFFEPDAFERQAHRDLAEPEWARVVVYPATTSGVDGALAAARHADILVKASGVGVFDEFLERAVLDTGGRDTLRIFWDVDAPATLDRVQADPLDPFLPLIPRYDLVLTYGGGSPVVDAYTRLGARRCVPIYNGFDPETHHPVEPVSEYRASLAFLGNRLPDREARVEEFFLRPASRLPAETFILGGNGWEPHRLPPNVRHLGHVPTVAHNAFNCSPRAVLNVNRESMARYGFSPATRVFEAAGAGACLVTDAFEGLERFLEPGQEVLVAASGDEIVELLAALDDDEARRIGEAARRRVLAGHTYEQRVRQLLPLLELAPQ